MIAAVGASGAGAGRAQFCGGVLPERSTGRAAGAEPAPQRHGVAAGSEANQRLQRGSAGSVALHSGGAWRGMRALTAVQRLGPRADRQLALGYTTAADIRLTRPACSFDACFAAAGSRGAWPICTWLAADGSVVCRAIATKVAE